MKPTMLITSFEPFDQRSENQSLIVASSLVGVTHLSLPVVFEKAAIKLDKFLQSHTFDFILCLGEAPIQSLHLEHVALNIMHARIPDNEGFQPLNQPIDVQGKDLYWTSLPLKDIAKLLQENNHPFQESYHAGTYVCNDLFYRVMTFNISSKRGFIHVPSERLKTPESIQGVQAIVNLLCRESNS